MEKIFSFIHRHRYDIFYVFLLFGILCLIAYILPQEETKSILDTIESKTFDIRQKIISKDKKANKDIVIVTIDDPSYEYLIETYGDWPVPRHVYAELLHYIQEQKPKFVAFDLLFIKSLKRIPQSDEKLIEAFKKYPNTYTAINFDDYSFEIRKPPLLNKKITTDINIESKSIVPYEYSNCRPIMSEIIEATGNIGHINTPKADDGLIRQIPIFINYPDYNEKDYSKIKIRNYLYMTVKMAIDYLNKYENANINEIKVDSKNNFIIGDRIIPLTKNAEAILNWYGESGIRKGNTFTYVSMWEVIKSLRAKKSGQPQILKDDFFKDKIVYIGTSVFALSDIKTVPTSKYMPGVEIHATLLNNILENNVIHKASLPYNAFLSLILSVLTVLIVFKVRSVYVSLTLLTMLIFCYIYYSTFVMAKYNLWIWIIIPLIISLIVFVISFIIKYLITSRNFEYTYKLATTDGLTELYNHRFFQEQIRIQIRNAEKTKGNFSLILIDIDFFKKFNDKYGHQAGDAVLKHVARTLKSSVRTEDFVCRYGGEEMTIILKNAKRETGVKIAQNICSTIASRKYELSPELEVNITISLGVATYPENGTTPTDLIEYADKCLYKAKENGRNQVGFLD